MTVLLHILSLAHGLSASLAFFLVLHVAGRALTPRRLEPTLNAGATPALIGAAVLVFAGWFGVKASVPVRYVAVAFLVGTVVLAAARWTHTRAALQRVLLTPRARWWAALYASLYVLAYVYTLPPVTGKDLPIAWLGNLDLLYYLNETAYVLRLGPVSHPIISTEYFAYFQTPGVFTLLGSFSGFFGFSPMSAMMPAQFSLMAATGWLSARMARWFFRTSPVGTVVVGLAAVSAPFFRYIAGEYYLSTLLSLPVLLHLLASIVRRRPGDRLFSWPLTASLFVHHALLFFIYPFLLLVSLPFEGAAIVLRALAAGRATKGAWPRVLRDAAARSVAACASLAAVVVCAPLQAAWALRMIVDLSRPGIAGWELDVISPLALLGLPTSLLNISWPALKYWGIAGVWAIAVLAAAAYQRPVRNAFDANRRTFFGLAALGFLIYASYLALVGRSYQQWKLASYVAMPYSFVFVAGLVSVCERRAGRVRLQQASAPRYLVLLAGFVLVGGGLAVHAAFDPALHVFPAALRNLAALTSHRFHDVSIDTRDHWALLSLYYLPGKRVHFSGTKLGFEEPLSMANVSPARPMMVFDMGCDRAGHSDVVAVDALGCLILQPATPLLEVEYPFSHNWMFLDHHGLSIREGWGRWNGRSTATLSFTIDQRRVSPYQAAYLNLELKPALGGGVTQQRVRLRWGNGRLGETILAGGREWVSLPLKEVDWTGDWVSVQTVSLEFLDRVPPHWVDGRFLETRELSVAFLTFSVTSRPRGRIVPPIS